MSGGEGLGTARLVARKALVELGGTALLRVLSLVRLVVLARLFLPEEYGAYSTGLVFIAPGLLLLNSGFRQYATKVPEDRVPGAFAAGLLLTSGLFLALALLLAAVGPLLGRWMGDPDLAAVLLVLVLSLLDGPLGMPQALLDRRLEFAAPKVAEAVSMLAGLGLTLLLHLQGVRPALAMAAGHAATTVLRGLSFFWLARPLPPLRLTREELAAQWRFCLPMFGTSGFAIVGERADDLAVRYYHGNGALGIYSVAFYAPALLQEVAFALDRITLPVLAGLESAEARRRAFADSTRIIAFITLPVGMAMACFSRPVLTFGLGPEWAPAAAPLAVLGVAFGVRACAGTNWGALAFLSEQTAYVGKVSVANAVLILAFGVPLVWWQGPLGGALYTLAYALVLGPLLRFPLMKRALGDLSFLRAAARPLAVSTLAAAGALSVGSQGLAPLPGTLACLVFVVATMGATLAADPHLRAMAGRS